MSQLYVHGDSLQVRTFNHLQEVQCEVELLLKFMCSKAWLSSLAPKSLQVHLGYVLLSVDFLF